MVAKALLLSFIWVSAATWWVCGSKVGLTGWASIVAMIVLLAIGTVGLIAA